MAKGNWKPNVIKPKMRCLLCGRVLVKRDMVRLDGISPAHEICAIRKNREYTFGTAMRKTEIELTDSVSTFVD